MTYICKPVKKNEHVSKHVKITPRDSRGERKENIGTGKHNIVERH